MRAADSVRITRPADRPYYGVYLPYSPRTYCTLGTLPYYGAYLLD